jgi:hypothetical protein
MIGSENLETLDRTLETSYRVKHLCLTKKEIIGKEKEDKNCSSAGGAPLNIFGVVTMGRHLCSTEGYHWRNNEGKT